MKLFIKKIKIILIIFLCNFVFSKSIYSDNWWYSEIPNPKIIGSGTLKVFLWKVYKLKLYSEIKEFNDKKNIVLEFEYLMDVSKKSTIQASLDQLKKNSNVNNNKLKKWKKYLEKSIYDMKAGEKAAIFWNPIEKQIIFFKKGEKQFIIFDGEFGKYFIDIWVGKKTSKPSLRLDILGIRE